MRELLELLEHDARRPVSELAAMLHRSEYQVEKEMANLEKDKIILSYNTLINWEKFGADTVTAIIEINLTPQREVGFDAIAERIYRFPQVKSLYLMSGGYDLKVVIEGDNLKEVAGFVSSKLSTLNGVRSTKTHFLLKKYKENDVLYVEDESDRREGVMA